MPLIKEYARLGMMENAHEIIHRMRRRMFGVSSTPFVPIVQKLCIQGELDKAMQLTSQLGTRHDIKPGIIMCRILLNALIENEDLDNALTLLLEMEAAHRIPPSSTYGALIKLCISKGEHNKAREVVAAMRRHGFRLDVKTKKALDTLNSTRPVTPADIEALDAIIYESTLPSMNF